MDSLKVMILGAQQYSFEDDKTGREVSGTTIHYIQLDASTEENKVGYFPSKASLPYAEFYLFEGLEFPLLAEAKIKFDLSNKRNPIKITGFTLQDKVSIN